MTTTDYGHQGAPLQRRASATAITGFIFGLLLCIPLVSGMVAILLSALGIRATRDPLISGRGLAIAGLVLGILNFLMWMSVGGILLLAFAATAAPRGVMQEFATKMGAGDLTGAAALCDTTLSPTDLEDLQKKFTALGTFESLTSWNTSISTVGGVGTCTATGTITFSGRTRIFEAQLTKDGGPWKVERFTLK